MISEEANSMAQLAQKAATAADKGTKHVSAVAESMNASAGRMDVAMTAIRTLAEDIGRIASIVHVIEDISAQTNLLALNHQLKQHALAAMAKDLRS